MANRTPYAVDVTGGGRSFATSRRMSALTFAIWNTPLPALVFGPAIANGSFTSPPAVCGAIMRRCRCRRAAGCRPRLLAIPPFQSARAGAPVQAPKTASLLVSRQWPWTYVVATSSTSWKRWRGRPPRELMGSWRSAPGCPPSADAARRLSRGPRSGGASLTEGRDKTARRLMGHNPRNQCERRICQRRLPG